MSFADSRSRIVDTAFERFGEDASWSGVTGLVRIHRVRGLRPGILPEANPVVADQRFGPQSGYVRVRPDDVATPRDGDIVAPVVGSPLTVVGDPVRDRKQIWFCEVLAFDRVVTVLQYGLANDGYGDPRPGYTPIGEVAAAIRSVAGGELTAADQLRGYSRRYIRLLRDAIGAVVTTADRLTIDGVEHAIKSVAELGRGIAIELIAEARA